MMPSIHLQDKNQNTNYPLLSSGHVQKLTSFSGPEEIIIIINSWYEEWEAVLKKIVIEGV